ncbi:diacylglycerol kinase [Polymorphobacter arshaanensis]|uniref:Diacylglycerol kinase n=1 Tax=Glacieibacterium arshaanense TaxID=2511025 RepID=A0A4Y9EQ92_9SPHN|nr:diacylglycerol kinase [Polymorphobacter arshaanensis]TFU05781.1 diacylglycerol kinase [Polymorphobacter arshaanensis]
MKNRPFIERMGFALAGLKAAWQREASFRTHCVMGLLAVAALALLRPAPVWWAVILLVVALILALELVNSALEGVIDHLHPEHHPEIKIIKDMVAGAVLVLSGTALLVALALAVDLWMQGRLF